MTEPTGFEPLSSQGMMFGGAWRGWGAKLGSLGLCAILLACGEASKDAPLSARGDGGSAGNAAKGGSGPLAGADGASGATLGMGGSRAGSGGAPSDISPDASRAWTWQECGRIPNSGWINVRLQHSPDGSTLAALTVGKQLVFHRLPLGTREPTVAPHDGFPFNAEEILFSPDSSLTYELGLPIVVRNVSDASLERTLDVAWLGDRGVISPDGESLLTYSAPGRGTVYRTADGTALFSIKQVLSGGFHAGKVVILGCDKPLDLCTFDLEGVERERVELATDGALAGCPVNPPCHKLSGCPAIEPCRVFDVVTREDSAPMISPDGDVVVAVEVRVRGDVTERFATAWSVADKRRLWSRSLVETFGYKSVLFAPGGKAILLEDHVLRATDGELLFTVPPSNHFYRSLAPDASTLATSEDRPTLLNARTGSALRLFRTHAGGASISSLAISGDGRILVTNAIEAIGFELAADFSDSKPLWSATADGALEADVSADGRFATLSGDVRKLLDARGGREVWVDPEYSSGPNFMGYACFGGQFRFSPDGRWLAGKRHATSFDVFALDDMSLVSRIETNDCSRGLSFSPDSAFLQTPEVRVPTMSWPPPAERRYPGPSARQALPREFIEIAPNGVDQIVTGWDAGLQTWRSSYNGGPPLISATSDLSHPRAPRFSPEGHWVVVGGTLTHLPTGEVRILDAAATEGLFAPNGNVIVGKGDASMARFCRTPGQ